MTQDTDIKLRTSENIEAIKTVARTLDGYAFGHSREIRELLLSSDEDRVFDANMMMDNIIASLHWKPFEGIENYDGLTGSAEVITYLGRGSVLANYTGETDPLDAITNVVVTQALIVLDKFKSVEDLSDTDRDALEAVRVLSDYNRKMKLVAVMAAVSVILQHDQPEPVASKRKAATPAP